MEYYTQYLYIFVQKEVEATSSKEYVYTNMSTCMCVYIQYSMIKKGLIRMAKESNMQIISVK